jgi:hypothetical protein
MRPTGSGCQPLKSYMPLATQDIERYAIDGRSMAFGVSRRNELAMPSATGLNKTGKGKHTMLLHPASRGLRLSLSRRKA